MAKWIYEKWLCLVQNESNITLLFPQKGLFKNSDDLKALHLAITILNLVTITTLTIITNYNTFKLNQETFTQLSKLL